MHQNGETAVLYDCYGKESGRIVIKELLIGQDENKGKFSESGQTGKIIFQYEEVQSEQFWKSQYVISGKKQDDLPKK
jgi:hypothetical protein